MWMTIGKYAIVAATAFAIGVFLGRANPPKSSEARAVDEAMAKLSQMFPESTPTPAPATCSQPSSNEKMAVQLSSANGVDGNRWARVEEAGTVYVAAATTREGAPFAVVSFPDGNFDEMRALNFTAQVITDLPEGPSTMPKAGQHALDCVDP